MPIDTLWAFGIPALQLAVCLRGVGFLRTFLMVEAFAEIFLAFLNLFGIPNVYLYAWLAGTFFHHAMCGYLLANIYSVVRLRGLPSRRSRLPIYLIGILAAATGISYAHLALGLTLRPELRMFLPLDHAISFAIGCMVVMLPFYCKAISSSLPRPIQLAFLGFVIYETAYAGLLGMFIIKQHLNYPHLIDAVYLVSLSVWSIALRSHNPAEVPELLPITR